MKNNKFKTFILTIVLIGVVIVYLAINTLNLQEIKQIFNDKLMFRIIILLLILLTLYILSIVKSKGKTNKLKYKDKLFKTLVESTDTLYIMINTTNNKIVYLSDNIEKVLGIKTELDIKKNKQLAQEILNIPILKSELKNWDGKSEYVSQMLSYDNPMYQHHTWIKVKIYPYKEKKDNYNVIQISDVSKEHDRQHLLITQTIDIKSREKQLNQITASSYDVEINVNVTTHTYELKYFKQDMKYFGLERSGNFNTDFKEIVKQYINTNDQEEVLNTLSIDNFVEKISYKKTEPITIRYRIGNQVKNNIWLESTIFFIPNKDKYFVSILTKNVTENAESIREQNILLQNALNEAKIANSSKTNLIKTISHDIRTQLTTIKGLSESLVEKQISEDIKEDIKNIKEASIEVIYIIDGLLDISKIEKGIIKKEETQYSIISLFKKLENITKEYIGNKNIKLNLDLDANLPVVLFGDGKRIFQTLNAILNNSVKYTDEGEININVIGEKINDEVNLKITVKDSGCGIEEDKLNSIFNTNNNSVTGLNNVKKLIDLLDGKIEIESKLNEYTSVTVYINQKIAEDNKIREMMQRNQEVKAFDLSNKKVLLVDDNKLNIKVASRMLEAYRIDITAVESGQECLDYVKQSNYDLILIDQMMPGMDGTTTLNKLKQINSFNTPVVVLTANAMLGQKEKYLESGFDDYLAKPIEKIELSRILKKFLN